MIKPWNEETSIANDTVRVVKFYFDTSEGEGIVIGVVNKGISIENAKTQMVEVIQEKYHQFDPSFKVEIVKHKILQFLNDIDDLGDLDDIDDVDDDPDDPFNKFK